MEDVILDTSMGRIVCEMYYDHAPRTCKNFVELVPSFPCTQVLIQLRQEEDTTMELLYLPSLDPANSSSIV